MQEALLGYSLSGTVVISLEQCYVLQPASPSKVSRHLGRAANVRWGRRAASQRVAREASKAAPRRYRLDRYAMARFPLLRCKLGSGMYIIHEMP